MGLNDLTLEKLIGEINTYKLRMQTLYEDYGRAAQDLQDRINVLGYNLNEQLKDVKDSISSTPQRLLTLETKYVSGEVSDQEYRVQRTEFKSLLQHNLHTIEDIKSMINVLSMIEARPLGPAEIRQATPNSNPVTSNPPPVPANLIPRAYGPTVPSSEDRNRPASFPEKPSYVAQLPTQQPSQVTPSSNNPSSSATGVDQVVSTFPFTEQSRNPWQEPTARLTPTSPSPQQPQPETSQVSLQSTSATLAPESAPASAATQETIHELPASAESVALPERPSLEDSSKPQISEAGPSTISVTESNSAVIPDPNEQPSIQPELATSPNSNDVTLAQPNVPEPTVGTENSTPSTTENNVITLAQPDSGQSTIDADDALTVKVVEDFPATLEASAVVETSEAQLQSPFGGGVTSELSPGVSAPSDVAQVSPSQPSPFYKVVCPKCGADVPQPAKVWELKGGKSKKNVLIGLFQCQDCRVKFREALTREII